ncbi:exodeoxyribonuclease VII large subunit [Dietzia sp. ANT_WB102]|uniref:exodeoxyribonuclease VII large subunit n=1 Tax=Dietzia sp. ANT_WB102 TaxID=2597345 RepID=UPI0011ECF122|nr:exodeoxyribonuclease VII large subunit [Dietzia sp. ANT_WB102]KAA0919340.1 exodeoxyribonuclease VII large subunit [Dietzia sp. ANT_WB102]
MTASSPRSPSSAEQPWPVRVVSDQIAAWIHRLGAVWVEGQITQLSLRPGTRTAFLTLRDPSVDNSLTLTCPPKLISESPVPVTEGSRVVVRGTPRFYTGRGSFSLQVSEIRPVGVGELLARIERLKQALAAEGLFDPRLKRPLPFLPMCVGLITGRASAAERDVVEVARGRWPDVRFAVRNTAVQGVSAVPQILDALAELDADPAVDVIILARGGGSVEDLLPFSDEALIRAISRCRTPVVSAIGHEPDSPLSDLVADLRAATPTDAAKRVVPDVIEERRRIAEARARTARALRGWVDRERNQLAAVRSRPCMSNPYGIVESRAEVVAEALRAARRDITRILDSQSTSLGHLSARLTTLGPAATLARGYAVVQSVAGSHDGRVVSSIADAPPGSQLRIRVSDGALSAAVLGSTPAAGRIAPPPDDPAPLDDTAPSGAPTPSDDPAPSGTPASTNTKEQS